ncbi:glutaredoxin family protein [Conexibacter sp. W3-3-2]|uniref:glutaredoxin family protein n=1 Tax=Conexibacter sp. W3-3-2 TaxID=2675227 RepID=UPI00132A95B3|nr:glutaredoxin family protein [Conexibacter sp. W3-3-2]MTD42898.1 glutaredoxin family protein [Conexibacter sp. W3-3-2]
MITVHVREGCHLCDDALALLRPLAAEHGEPLEVVDIEADDDLHRRYLERIPVICLDGEELYDFFVDEADLRGRLRHRLGGR